MIDDSTGVQAENDVLYYWVYTSSAACSMHATCVYVGSIAIAQLWTLLRRQLKAFQIPQTCVCVHVGLVGS